MPLARIPKNLPAPVKRERDGMDRKHLENVRDLPCCITGNVIGVEAHHLLRTGEHGMGRKSADRWAIPLTKEMHDALHRAGGEDAFLAAHGIDGRALASALWSERGNLEGMLRVTLRALQAARLKRNPRPLVGKGAHP